MQWVANLLEVVALPDRRSDIILRRAEADPSFAEEVIRIWSPVFGERFGASAWQRGLNRYLLLISANLKMM